MNITPCPVSPSPVSPSPVSWPAVFAASADALDGRWVSLDGWALVPDNTGDAGTGDAGTGDAGATAFLLLPEPPCCAACPPADPLAAVEVAADTPLAVSTTAPVTVTGLWCRLPDDDGGGWRYQMRHARVSGDDPPIPGPAPAAGFAFSRRAMLAAGAALGLAAGLPASGRAGESGIGAPADGPATVDIHSHAGRVSPGRGPTPAPLEPLADPMRQGGMNVVCLAIVADTPVTRIEKHRIKPVRAPEPGELYGWSRSAFARLHELVRREGLGIVTDAATLRAARRDRPSVIVAAEGADFLDGILDRVDEAWDQQWLRHLQLTHYRVNELGDIQTEAPVHGGLTAFGADVIRRCNRLGIVVDVAHGTADLVRRAAEVTDKPLVLSHTSLGEPPGPRSRTISADHARLVAGTGGVIGVWPPATRFPDLDAYAAGIARLAAVVGVEHVGVGSDMLGLVSASVFPSYTRLPDLRQALARQGFQPAETAAILGGNYVRVFTAVTG